MGYTHYYTVNGWHTAEWEAAWPQIIQDAQLILEASDVLVTGPPDDTEPITPPIIDKDNGIYLNGVGDDSHEPFRLSRKYRDLFVKTLQKPYDLAVACILLRAYQLAPSNFELYTDGSWDDEWTQARQLYRQLWPDATIKCSWEDAEDCPPDDQSITNGQNTGSLSKGAKTASAMAGPKLVNGACQMAKQSQILTSPLSQLKQAQQSVISSVDMLPIRNWLAQCSQDPAHHQCNAPTLEWRELPGVGFKVIDIERECIVEAPDACSFIVLTYVWGGVDQPRLTADTIPVLMQEGGLGVMWPQLPATIRDALLVCQSLGERYLWVDALCITQDSQRDMQFQILRMRQIYSAAKCTIAAVSSNSANTGLFSVIPTNCSKTCDTVEDLDDLLQQAPWSSRAWCYQEKVLSHRMIMFTTNGIYMQCQNGTCNAEGLSVGKRHEKKEPDVARFDAVGGMLYMPPGEELVSYLSAVESYSKRKLTKSGDKLNAFQGVLQRYKGMVDGKETSFYFGLPMLAFDQTFCWRARRHNPQSRNTSFPSWSWLGWDDAVSFDRKMVQVARTNQMIRCDRPFRDWNEDAQTHKLRKPAPDTYSLSDTTTSFGFPAAVGGLWYNNPQITAYGSLANVSIASNVSTTDGSNGLYAVFPTKCRYQPSPPPSPSQKTMTLLDLLTQPLPEITWVDPKTEGGPNLPVENQVGDEQIDFQHDHGDCEAKHPLGYIWLDQAWRAKQPSDYAMKFMALAGEQDEQAPDKWIITMLMCLQGMKRGKLPLTYDRVQVMDCAVDEERWLNCGATTTYTRLS